MFVFKIHGVVLHVCSSKNVVSSVRRGDKCNGIRTPGPCDGAESTTFFTKKNVTKKKISVVPDDVYTHCRVEFQNIFRVSGLTRNGLMYPNPKPQSNVCY